MGADAARRCDRGEHVLGERAARAHPGLEPVVAHTRARRRLRGRVRRRFRAGAALTGLLDKGSDGYRWVAAAVGANSAAGYQLASDEPIMAIGGFNGTDPTPTLAEFQQYVADGDVHYFIAGGGGFGAGGFGPG